MEVSAAIRATRVDDAVLKCALAECERQESENIAAAEFRGPTGAGVRRALQQGSDYCAPCKFFAAHAAALFVHLMQCAPYRAEIEP